MKLKIVSAAIAISMVGLAGVAYGQKKSNTETGLLGVKLYSTGLTVIEKFGTPDSIEAVNVGGSVSAGGGPGGGGPGGPANSGGPRMSGTKGGGGGGATAAAKYTGPGEDSPLDFANSLLQSAPGMPRKGSGGEGLPPGVPTGPGGRGPRAAGAAGGGPTGGGPAGGATGSSGNVLFTRWVYNRGGCQYAFIFDKFNRVVQIEAVGLGSSLAHTRRGVGLGATIGNVIKKYEYNPGHVLDAPEYDINGDTVTLKFLILNHVAFRFSRLQTGHPQVCTGIAVSAGKY